MKTSTTNRLRRYRSSPPLLCFFWPYCRRYCSLDLFFLGFVVLRLYCRVAVFVFLVLLRLCPIFVFFAFSLLFFLSFSHHVSRTANKNARVDGTETTGRGGGRPFSGCPARRTVSSRFPDSGRCRHIRTGRARPRLPRSLISSVSLGGFAAKHRVAPLTPPSPLSCTCRTLWCCGPEMFRRAGPSFSVFIIPFSVLVSFSVALVGVCVCALSQ